jgi:histidyl-tRNA synthetase
MKLIEPRTLKGFRDYLPKEQIARSRMIREIVGVFELFGFEPLETPALEYQDVLAGKYGDEGEQLMYRFKDNGQRDVAMRYDLTVPLARVAAQHAAKLSRPFKRYQVAPVWRAENTQKGRYREFVQCDADIIGAPAGLADAECVAIAEQVMLRLGLKKFVIKVNNRKLLNAIMRAAGVAENKIVDAIRIVDKIEKVGAKGVSEELLEALGMSSAAAEKLINLVSIKIPNLAALKTFADAHISGDAQGLEGFVELSSVFRALDEMGVTHAEIDLALARGLDYYTGTIYETIITENPESKKFGSVAAGGRYDKLIHMFTGKDMPGVGVSIGLDRLFAAMEHLEMLGEQSVSRVLVLNLSEKLQPLYLRTLSAIREAGINAEIYYQVADFKKQYAFAESKSIPLAVIIGDNEAERAVAAIRNLKTREQIEVPQSKIVSEIISELRKVS